MSIFWPRNLLIPRHCIPNPAPATVAGPAALSGFRQTVASPAAVWSIAYTEIVVASIAQRKCLRALAALVEGRTTPIRIPIYDLEELRPILQGADLETAPHDDGSVHDDDAPYEQDRALIRLLTAVERGDTSMTVEIVYGGPIVGGEHFSAVERLYRVKNINDVDDLYAQTTFSFWPPAREDIPAGFELSFDRPVCKVRLANDNGLDLALDFGRYGFPSVEFIEDPT